MAVFGSGAYGAGPYGDAPDPALTVGRETVQIVQIRQPFCAHTFGSLPCAATGTDDEKCYRVRASCRDTVNFTLGTPLDLYFSKGTVADQAFAGLYVIPSLKSVSTAPTRVNIAGANPDAQGLGNRAMCSITIMDHPHTDNVVDPYLAGRSWDPMSPSRGSFWTRWLARNKYRQNVQVIVYDGYAGQQLDAMIKRTYFLQNITAPDASGRVTLQCKDILARVEERKSQAPAKSPGKLYANIDAVVTSFEVANAVESDYSANGTLRIGSEVMTYTGRAASAYGVTFTGVARGTDATTAVAHSLDDDVQWCLRYTNQTPDAILSDLLANYGGVSSSWLDTANWAIETMEYIPAYRLTRLITAPEGVNDLVSQVQEASLVYLWWDERVALVKLKVVRGVDAEPDLLTAETNILAGSFSISEKPRERASQVWIYYAPINPTAGVTTVSNYKTVALSADLESETPELYGEPSIRKVFAPWLLAGALAETTASKIITRYVDVPSECSFQLDAKDRGYWVGDTVTISHHLDVDLFGERRLRNWTIVSAEETVSGDVVQYTAEDTTLYGKISYIMAAGAADYDPGNVPFYSCYIGNAGGLLSDGKPSGRIS